MRISILKTNSRKAGLFLGCACILGVIIAGLPGCSSDVPEPNYPVPSKSTASLPATPLEIISVQVNKTSLSEKGLDLLIEAKVKNPNPFTVNIETPQLTIQGIAGTTYGDSTASGSQIGETAVQSFYFNPKVPVSLFNEQSLAIRTDLKSEHDGTVSPASKTTVLNLRETLDKILLKPAVFVQAKYQNITWNGSKPQLIVQAKGSIKNPNPFELVASSVTIIFQDGQGKTINSGTIEGTIIVMPNSEQPFEKTLILPIETLNDRGVLVNADVTAGSLYSLSSLKAKAPMNSYKLGELIKTPQIVIEPRSDWTGGISVNTLKLTVNTTLINDNPFNLTAGEMVIKAYKPADKLMGTATQTGFSSGISAASTKKMSNLITTYLNDVKEIAGDVLIVVSIPVGIENVDEKSIVSSSIVYTVRP